MEDLQGLESGTVDLRRVGAVVLGAGQNDPYDWGAFELEMAQHGSSYASKEAVDAMIEQDRQRRVRQLQELRAVAGRSMAHKSSGHKKTRINR